MVKLSPEIIDFVRKQRLGFIATVSPDGTPNLSPKGTTTIWDDEHLVFADIHSPNTAKNLSMNGAVEINVVDPVLRKGYRFKGKAAIYRTGQIYEKGLSLYGNKVEDCEKQIKSIVIVKIDRVAPLISPGYDSGLTEEDMKAKWESYYSEMRQNSSRQIELKTMQSKARS